MRSLLGGHPSPSCGWAPPQLTIAFTQVWLVRVKVWTSFQEAIWQDVKRGYKMLLPFDPEFCF